MNDRATLAALSRILAREGPSLRPRAAACLGQVAHFGDPARPAEPALVRALDDVSARVRRAAALALREIDFPKPKGAIDPLLLRLSDAATSVREAASLALGTWAPWSKAHEARLAELLGHREADVRRRREIGPGA